MDGKRYQVFISSTIQDLKDARKEVSQALLRAECFPAGMEQFSAVDEEQFEYIKKIIDESDYYIVISAGRYGSIHPETGLSYTEMEYDYAVETGKPVMRMLHRDPFNKLTGEHIEQTDKGKRSLKAFRRKMSESRMVREWIDPSELGREVIFALLDMKKTNPAVGWVRGDNALSLEVLNELEELRSTAKKSDKKANTESVVNFEELTKKTPIEVKACNNDDESDIQVIETAEIDNKVVAEIIFLLLLENSRKSEIFEATKRKLDEWHKFSGKASKFKYFWVEFELDQLSNFLNYFEARGLLRVQNPGMSTTRYELTGRGRQHAAFISSLNTII